MAGAVPESGFSYFGHYELYQDGGNDLEQGFGVYTGGKANSSYFVKAGEMHMQEGEGTRAAMFYNLFSDPAYTLTNVDPISFSLDQHPVGVDVGYTWASNYFKNVFAVSAKVTNGLNADGSEILDASTKNSKDVWADADYWFGPDGGVTVMIYRGTKDQIQNAGTADQFTYPAHFLPRGRLRQLSLLRQAGSAGRLHPRAGRLEGDAEPIRCRTTRRIPIAARRITTSRRAR